MHTQTPVERSLEPRCTHVPPRMPACHGRCTPGAIPSSDCLYAAFTAGVNDALSRIPSSVVAKNRAACGQRAVPLAASTAAAAAALLGGRQSGWETRSAGCIGKRCCRRLNPFPPKQDGGAWTSGLSMRAGDGGATTVLQVAAALAELSDRPGLPEWIARHLRKIISRHARRP